MNKNVALFFLLFIVLISVQLSEEQTNNLPKILDDLQVQLVRLGIIFNDLTKELTGMDLTVRFNYF